MSRKPPCRPGRDDAALWHRVARDVKPLRRGDAGGSRATEAGAPEAPKPEPTRKRPSAHPRVAPAPAPVAAPALAAGAATGLDRRNLSRLRRGQLALDGRIDLHGMTRDEARAALFDFLARLLGRGARCVLVITGKGLRGQGSGVIRAELPRWLNDPSLRPGIVAFAQAQPKDGGAGAFYVYLRRRRQR